jgi:hypothetical protein
VCAGPALIGSLHLMSIFDTITLPDPADAAECSGQF